MTDVLDETTTTTHWPVGQRFRITSGEDDHGFPRNTIVTATANPNDPQGWPKTGSDTTVLATTVHEDAATLTVSDHDIGVTAWVLPGQSDLDDLLDDEGEDSLNCVPVTVRHCDATGHPHRQHHHSRWRGELGGYDHHARLWSTPTADVTREVDGNGQQVVYDRSLPAPTPPAPAPLALTQPPDRMADRRRTHRARIEAVKAGRAFSPSSTGATRDVPDAPLPVRITTPVTGSTSSVGEEAWLWQIDDSDSTCTFLVAKVRTGGGGSTTQASSDRPRILPPDLQDAAIGIDWVYDVEVIDAPTPVVEEVLVHGSTPEWPVYRCTHSHTYARTPHYHVTRHGGSGNVLHHDSVHNDGSYDTVRGARFGVSREYPEWNPAAASHDVNPEPIAEHATTPAWPVRRCTHGHVPEPHYHVTRGGEAFNREGPVLYNTRVHEEGGFHTEQGYRYGSGDHITDVQYVDPHPEASRTTNRTTFRPGVRYRVTSTAGGHQFPVGTIVTSLETSDSRLPTFHATVTPVTSPWADLPQCVGTTAYVTGPNTESFYDPVNVELVDPVGLTVMPCEEGHKPEVHTHWVMGDKTYAMPADFNPAPAVRQFWSQPEPGRFAKGEHLPSHDVNPSEPQVGPSIPDDLTPEEVARRLRAREGVEEGLRRRDAQPIEDLLVEVRQARTARNDARAERGVWINEAIRISRQYAQSAQWCGVYDRTMEELGLPTRHQDIPGSLGVVYDDDEDTEPEPVTEDITVSARAEITVLFDDGDFDNWFESRHDVSVSSNSNSATFTFGIDVEQTVTVTEGECGCDDVECDTSMLPNWVSDNGYDWEIENRSCSND